MKRKPFISQDTLARYLTIRNQRLSLDKQSRELNREEDALEQQIKGMLDKNVKIETGKLTCRFGTGGKYPKWKEEFEKRLGANAVNDVIANTPSKQVFIVEIAIQEERKSA